MLEILTLFKDVVNSIGKNLLKPLSLHLNVLLFYDCLILTSFFGNVTILVQLIHVNSTIFISGNY